MAVKYEDLLKKPRNNIEHYGLKGLLDPFSKAKNKNSTLNKTRNRPLNETSVKMLQRNTLAARAAGAFCFGRAEASDFVE